MENQESSNDTYCIYCHTSPNGKRYIGQTKHGDNPIKRWGYNGVRYQTQEYFWKAIQKYGWNNFTHEILEENLTLEQANKQEQYWISQYDTTNPTNGYNCQEGGSGGVPSAETRKKLSESRIGYHPTQEALKNMSLATKKQNEENPELKEYRISVLTNYVQTVGPWNKGVKGCFSEETIQKMRDSHTNQNPSEEVRLKLSNSLMGHKGWSEGKRIYNNGKVSKYFYPGEEPEGFVLGCVGKLHWFTNGITTVHVAKCPEGFREGRKQPNIKKVVCIENDTIYDNCGKAAQSLGLLRSHIRAVCIGKRKQTGGYHFKYYEEQEVSE